MKIKLIILLILMSPFCFAQSAEDLADKASEKFVKGDYKTALKLYDKAIDLDPTNAALYDSRAGVYVELKQYQSAVLDYNKALNLNPECAMCLHHRAILYYSLQYPEKAIEDNTKALEYAGDNDSLKCAVIVNRGGAKAMKRDFEGAAADFLLVLKYDSTSISALTNLGAVLDNLGREEEAIKYLEKVILLDPEFVGGYANLAFRYMEMGNYAKALELNNKVLELDGTQPLAYNNRGYVKYKMGDLKDALKDINQSIKLYPANSYAFKNRALVYLELGKNDLACEDIFRALELGFTKMYGNEVEELKQKHCDM